MVESTNGHVKTWRLFDRVLPNSMISVVGDLFSIICALINAYRPIFIQDMSKNDEIADAMIARSHESNKLKDCVENMSKSTEMDIDQC